MKQSFLLCWIKLMIFKWFGTTNQTTAKLLPCLLLELKPLVANALNSWHFPLMPCTDEYHFKQLASIRKSCCCSCRLATLHL